MVDQVLAPKWSPLGLLQRVRRLIEQPGDVVLLMRIGAFLCRVPADLDDATLPELLDGLRAGRRPPAPDLAAGVRRIARLRQPWLRLAPLHQRNTCYMRALTLYRFLDPGARTLRIHFGVEPGATVHDRLRGHAWVSVDDEILEPPEPVLAGRVREIYRHPPG